MRVARSEAWDRTPRPETRINGKSTSLNRVVGGCTTDATYAQADMLSYDRLTHGLTGRCSTGDGRGKQCWGGYFSKMLYFR